jgi:hypothetical protein
MNDNDVSDQDLRERFQSLRKFETASAPAFSPPGADRLKTTTRHPSAYRVPLAAAALICLIALPAVFFRPATSRSLSENLPVLLPASAEKSTLFAGLDEPGRGRPYFSDELLPFRLNLNL